MFELGGHQGGNASLVGDGAGVGLRLPDEAIGGGRHLDVVAELDIVFGVTMHTVSGFGIGGRADAQAGLWVAAPLLGGA